MRFIYLLLFVFLFALVSCKSYSDETTRLNTVLSKYNKTIPQKPHLFFVSSNFYCNGCVQSIYVQLENEILSNNKSTVTIIGNDKEYISKYLLSKVEFLQDSLNATDKEFPKYSNITIFKTNKGKVVSFKNIGDSQNVILPEFINQ